MYISETKITVRYAETDQMGIVHHSNYLIWFEAGRTDFIKGSNISYTEMEQEGILIPLAESNCKYIIGAKYEDEIIIKTWVKELTPVKVEFNFQVETHIRAGGISLMNFHGYHIITFYQKRFGYCEVGIASIVRCRCIGGEVNRTGWHIISTDFGTINIDNSTIINK